MKIGFIGVGDMAGAILRGFVRGNPNMANDILITGRDPEKYAKIAKRYNVKRENDVDSLTSESNIILLGVVPSAMGDVLKKMKPSMSENKIVITMAAGIKLDFYTKHLGAHKIIHIMPNTPVGVNEGRFLLRQMNMCLTRTRW